MQPQIICFRSLRIATQRCASYLFKQTKPARTNRSNSRPVWGKSCQKRMNWRTVVIPTTIDNLDYLAFSDCGSVLSSSFKPRVEKIVSELRKHYDLIFINGKSAEETETKSWTAIADATYLIVQLYGDDQTAAKEAATQLRKKWRSVGRLHCDPTGISQQSSDLRRRRSRWSTGRYSQLLHFDYDATIGNANRSAKQRGRLGGLCGQPFGIHHFSSQHVSSNVSTDAHKYKLSQERS